MTARTKKQAVFELLKDGEWHASPEVRKAGGDNPSRYVREIRDEIRSGKIYGYKDLMSERDGSTTRYRMVRSLTKSPPRGGIKPPEDKANGKLNPRAISREQKLEVEKAKLQTELDEAHRANAQLRARMISGVTSPDVVAAMKTTNQLMLEVANHLHNEKGSKRIAKAVSKQITANERALEKAAK
jgi:hypothetical protein